DPRGAAAPRRARPRSLPHRAVDEPGAERDPTPAVLRRPARRAGADAQGAEVAAALGARAPRAQAQAAPQRADGTEPAALPSLPLEGATARRAAPPVEVPRCAAGSAARVDPRGVRHRPARARAGGAST